MAISDYDPSAAADPNAGIFGLPYSYEEAKLIYLSVPWEATTSYGGGTVFGPQAIINASPQMDIYDLDVQDPYRCGLHALPVSSEIMKDNEHAKGLAQSIKDAHGETKGNPFLQKSLQEVNALSKKLNRYVFQEVSRILDDGKIAVLIGGDHSVPFGAFQAAAKKFGTFGILHFDAHSDTRHSYMGFEHSHASIMHNAATFIPEITQITQVGIRDFCDDEIQFTQSQGTRFKIFFDQHISDLKLRGKSFLEITESILQSLPDKVWVSFDIDGLDPRYCPHTGTPVPGGLEYAEAIFILKLLARSGRTIIGFDLNE
ncbi:MAG: arginase family protein, partial [Bdellovibrionales bacterium]|nr:arginase family protein [Oligoflexia bacterium]